MTKHSYMALPKTMLPPANPDEAEAAKYLGHGKGHGRLPTAIAKKVVEINDNRKTASRNVILKNNLLRRTKEGKIIKDRLLDRFLEEFLKNGGNATQAALSVGNYNSISSAASAGCLYLKQAKNLARVYMEKKGYGYGKMLDEAALKMKTSKTPEWWDRLMKIADYHDFISKDKSPQPAIVNVIQSHKDLVATYVEGEVEEVKPIEENEDKT